MTSREIVMKTIKFESPERLAYDFSPKFGSDFVKMEMDPTPNARLNSGKDEWGAVWQNIGVCRLGEVKEYPLRDWNDFEKLKIPEINDPNRWLKIKGARKTAGEKFLLGTGISIFERVHFLRGLDNTWTDIYEHPDELKQLINVLVEMNLAAIKYYAQEGFDGYYFTDDWGLQNKLMISPSEWSEFWKPGYEKIYKTAHEYGIFTFLHSCGHIVDILDELIEVGLDVINMDQQENMGLELLGNRFRGRITFYNPVDIQNTMITGSLEDIRSYCRNMFKNLGSINGGFIPKWYQDPIGVGHTDEAIDAMCEEFFNISNEVFGKSNKPD